MPMVPMFIAGESELPGCEQEYVARPKHSFSSSVLGAKDAQRIATMLGLPRITQEEPEWVRVLQRKAAAKKVAEAQVLTRPDPNAGGGSSDEDPYDGTATAGTAAPDATPKQPRRRRNSITMTIKSVLRPARPPSPDDQGPEPEPGPAPDVATQLATELEASGYGQALEGPEADDDLVLVGNDRVPRVFLRLGEALKRCGGLDKLHIFLVDMSDQELLEQAQLMRLGRSTSRVSRSWVGQSAVPPDNAAHHDKENFRYSTPSQQQQQAAAGIRQEVEAIEEQARRTHNPHAIAGLMKRWLGMLPAAAAAGARPPGTNAPQEKGLVRLTLAQLRATYSTKDPQLATRATLSELRGTVRGETFRWLAGLLAEVDRSSPRNRMPARELAITLAVLICPPPSDSHNMGSPVPRRNNNSNNNGRRRQAGRPQRPPPTGCKSSAAADVAGSEEQECEGEPPQSQPQHQEEEGHGHEGGEECCEEEEEEEGGGAMSHEEHLLHVTRFLQHAIAVQARAKRTLVHVSPPQKTLPQAQEEPQTAGAGAGQQQPLQARQQQTQPRHPLRPTATATPYKVTWAATTAGTAAGCVGDDEPTVQDMPELVLARRRRAQRRDALEEVVATPGPTVAHGATTATTSATAAADPAGSDGGDETRDARAVV